MNIKNISNLKKVIVLFLCFLTINFNEAAAYAGWFFEPKKPPVNDLAIKFEYVNINWWENFNDPYLKNYVIMAIKNNNDLKVATLKSEEYMQFVKESFGRELPELSVGSNYTGFKLPYSKDKPLNLSDSGYVLPFTVKYEADFLLKNHDKTKSAKKQYEAQKYQEKTAYISICSYVATVYLNIIKTDKLIALQSDFANIKKEQLKRISFKHSRGLASAIEVNNYKDRYKMALNELDNLTKSRDILLYELAVLIGDSPNNAKNLKRGSFDTFCFMGVLPESVPSDVIFARPDVQAIESQLEAAKIDIRVAKKELFPTFSIAGNLYFNTFTTDPFFSWNGAYASLIAGATQNLFMGGRKIANLRIKKNKYEQFFENYKQSHLKAIQEINDSLRSVKIDTNVDNQNFNRVKIEENTFIRTQNKYNNGVISCPDLLSEQEKFINIQADKVNSKASRFVNYLGLYKAAGGRI